MQTTKKLASTHKNKIEMCALIERYNRFTNFIIPINATLFDGQKTTRHYRMYTRTPHPS
jgi:hypothetical protein